MNTAHRSWTRLGGIVFALLLLFVRDYSTKSAPPSQMELPLLFRQTEVTSAILSQAVNHYVEIGEAASVKELSALDTRRKMDEGLAQGIYMDERVGWVCRILFLKKGKQLLRGPDTGALSLPYESMPSKSWPLLPVVATGSSYFILRFRNEGGFYSSSESPESITKYLGYCQTQGTFRTSQIPVPTRTQALRDVKALRQLSSWRAIRWNLHLTGLKYDYSETHIWNSMRDQAQNIPLGNV